MGRVYAGAVVFDLDTPIVAATLAAHDDAQTAFGPVFHRVSGQVAQHDFQFGADHHEAGQVAFDPHFGARRGDEIGDIADERVQIDPFGMTGGIGGVEIAERVADHAAQPADAGLDHRQMLRRGGGQRHPGLIGIFANEIGQLRDLSERRAQVMRGDTGKFLQIGIPFCDPLGIAQRAAPVMGIGGHHRRQAQQRGGNAPPQQQPKTLADLVLPEGQRIAHAHHRVLQVQQRFGVVDLHPVVDFPRAEPPLQALFGPVDAGTIGQQGRADLGQVQRDIGPAPPQAATVVNLRFHPVERQQRLLHTIAGLAQVGGVFGAQKRVFKFMDKAAIADRAFELHKVGHQGGLAAGDGGLTAHQIGADDRDQHQPQCDDRADHAEDAAQAPVPGLQHVGQLQQIGHMSPSVREHARLGDARVKS